MITGTKLTLARKIMGFSQAYMVSKLNHSQKTISRWESGKAMITDEIVEQYLEVLGKDKEWVEKLGERIKGIRTRKTNVNNSTDSNNSQSVSVKVFGELIASLSILVNSQQVIIEKYTNGVKTVNEARREALKAKEMKLRKS